MDHLLASAVIMMVNDMEKDAMLEEITNAQLRCHLLQNDIEAVKWKIQ